MIDLQTDLAKQRAQGAFIRQMTLLELKEAKEIERLLDKQFKTTASVIKDGLININYPLGITELELKSILLQEIFHLKIPRKSMLIIFLFYPKKQLSMAQEW